MTDVAHASTSAEDPLTSPVMLDSIMMKNPNSECNVPLNSPESEPEIESDEDAESEV
jgi:hypothetical protein